MCSFFDITFFIERLVLLKASLHFFCVLFCGTISYASPSTKAKFYFEELLPW